MSVHWAVRLVGLSSLAILAPTVLAACGGKEIPIGVGEDGSTITASVGDTIILGLWENRATGYRWNLVLPDGLAATSDSYTRNPQDGAHGIRTWRIEVSKVGKHALTARYYDNGRSRGIAYFYSVVLDIRWVVTHP